MPWNEKTFIGYICMTLFDIVAIEYYMIISGSLLLTFISICLHHRAFYKRFRCSVYKLEKPDEHKNDKEILCEMIRFHITAKESVFKIIHFEKMYFLQQIIKCFVFISVGFSILQKFIAVLFSFSWSLPWYMELALYFK